MVDFTKPIQTVGGKPVIIMSTKGPVEDFPVVGFIKGSEVVRTWSLSGTLRGGKGMSKMNLENAPIPADYSQVVTDGFSRDMATLDVMPEDNTIHVYPERGVEVKMFSHEGVEVRGGFHAATRNPQVGASKKISQTLEGGLAGAYFNQVRGSIESERVDQKGG